MPTINKISVVTMRTPSFQGSQSQNISMPIMPQQALKQDTVTFNGLLARIIPDRKYVSDEILEETRQAADETKNKTLFFVELHKLCQHAEREDIAEVVECQAQALREKYRDKAEKLLHKIKDDPETDPYLKLIIKDSLLDENGHLIKDYELDR